MPERFQIDPSRAHDTPHLRKPREGEYGPTEWDPYILNAIYKCYTRAPDQLKPLFARLQNLFSPDTYHQALMMNVPQEHMSSVLFALRTSKDWVPDKEQRSMMAEELLCITANSGMIGEKPPLPQDFPSFRKLSQLSPFNYHIPSWAIKPYDVHSVIPFPVPEIPFSTAARLNRTVKNGGYDLRTTKEIYGKHPFGMHRREYDSYVNALMEQKPIECDPAIIDKIRFLGYADERAFTSGTEHQLQQEIIAAGGDWSIVKQALRFSKESDTIRAQIDIQKGKNPAQAGRRKTGESYYCHPLATAWLYWTWSKPYLEQGSLSIQDVIRNVRVLFLHDTVEDVNANYHDDHLHIDGLNPLSISDEENILLESLTKESSGTDWLKQIQDTQAGLAEHAAAMKVIDRFHNLLTMRQTGSYKKVLGKLLETIFVGGHLQTQSTGIDNGEFHQRMEKLQASFQTGNTKSLFTLLPALAIVEADLLQLEFGQLLYQQLFKTAFDKPHSWLSDMMNSIHTNTQVDIHNTFNHINAGKINGFWTQAQLAAVMNKISEYRNPDYSWPLWAHRLIYLVDFHNSTPETIDSVHPASDLEYLSIRNYVSRLKKPAHGPLRFEQFNELVEKSAANELIYHIVPGIFPGSPDSFYVKRPDARLHQDQLGAIFADSFPQ